VNGITAYIRYLALNRHFKDEKYDFFKYNGIVRCSESKFNANRCCHFFNKLAKQYDDEQVVKFLVAPFIYNKVEYVWWQDYLSGAKLYERFVSDTTDLENTIDTELEPLGGFCKEIFQTVGKKHPPIVRWYISNQISPVVFFALEHCVKFLKDDDIILRGLKTKANKSIPFVIGD